MRSYLVLLIFLCLFIPCLVFAQNTQLGGIVTDPSNALVPGVTISATNTETGVVTTAITNDSGAYTFASLQPGKAYSLKASLAGFQGQTITGVELPPTSVRQNFQLKFATTVTNVEVSADASTAISANAATVGDVLSESRIRDLPIVGSNVLSLLDTLPGLRVSLVGPQADTIGGLSLNSINVTRDGLVANSPRFSGEGDLTAGTPIPNGGSIGVMSGTTINPDLVGEVRLILSPVDAELGRGNSQIQIQTRSGTNKYTGSANWNVRNSALNANTWGNNRQVNPRTGAWDPLKPDWRNVHEYTLSFGGPIMKNKTFFFVLWDQNISNLRSTMNVRVLTNEARQGIVRFWEGWVPDSGDPLNNPTQFPTAAANPTIASVDFAGKPIRPSLWPDGSPYTGRLICYSIFGVNKANGSPFGAADCPSGTDSNGNAYTASAVFPPGIGATLWDTKRPGSFSTSGYFNKILSRMPEANNFFDDNGDGLTMGVYQYLLTRKIGDPVFYNETLTGNDPFSNRKQINIKIDHNWKQHRISGGYTHQLDDNVVFRGEWPDAVEGSSYRRPHTFTLNVTSTLSATMLNEARFGYNSLKAGQIAPWLMPDSNGTEAQKLIVQGGTRTGGSVPYPIIARPVVNCPVFVGETTLPFDNNIMTTRLNCAVVVPNQVKDAQYQLADTFSWTHGKHAFKVGADLRLPRTYGFAFQPYVDAPYGNLGGAATQSPFLTDTAGTGTPILGKTQLGVGESYATTPVYRSDARSIATGLAYLLTDSIGSFNTPYWIENQSDKDNGITGWQDVTTRQNRIRATASHDFSLFVKDDYKFTKNLTLNLGVRYEYYDPPYLKSGLTATIAGLGNGLFGASQSTAGGQLFNNWLQPGSLYLTGYGNSAALAGASPLECKTGVTQNPLLPLSTCDPNSLSTVEFVGPGTSNPSKSIIRRDRNNFGPAIGFAWNVPWFGEGKTTVRGGYSAQFIRINVREQTLASAPGNTLNQAATANDADILAITATRAINAGDLSTLIPRMPATAPGAASPIYARNIAMTAYAPDLSTPYVQNLTLSVTRVINRKLTLDVRYVGTLARRLEGSLDLNASTVFSTPELFNALEVTRAGGNDPLFDQMFAGLRLGGVAGNSVVTGSGANTGSQQLRDSTTIRGNLANGNYVAVANALAGTLTIAAGSQGISGLVPGPQMAIVHNGCDRLANGFRYVQESSPGTFVSGFNASNATPLRCFPENYLIANPQLSSATYSGNFGRSNYHSLQAQFTLRPVAGLSLQSTYSWTKAIQLGTAGLGGVASNFTDPLRRNEDRQRSQDNEHNFRMNGTLELPIGPNKLLFGNTSGWLARAIERWQASFILNMANGQPSSIGGAGTMLYANGRYVATADWTVPEGKARWDGPNGNTGTFFGDRFVTVRDPQCTDTTVVAAALAQFCQINALAEKKAGGSQVNVLVNPRPGNFGTVGPRILDSWGQVFLDGNIQKTFRISESKQLSVRVDSTNILNHPQLATPNFTVGGTAFGQIASKGNALFAGPPVQRNFQGQLRFTF